MENSMVSFLKRTAESANFQRDSFLERDIPTVSSNIVILPFFGDLRSTALLSAFLLKPYTQFLKKYVILASWPGNQSLFPYVNEYWSLKDATALKSLAIGANNLYNTSEINTNIVRTLLQRFENVVTPADLQAYWDRGFTQKYWKDFGKINRYLPEVASANMIGADLKNEMLRKSGRKVVIFPVIRMRSWQKERVDYLQTPKEFWKRLIERLLAENIVPVIYQNHLTYDMSPDFADKCIYLVPKEISHVLCAMRYVGCVLDVHSGISRLAIAARCPFVVMDERARFMGDKDYEIDDLCCEKIPKQYLFSFSTMIHTGGAADWDTNILDGIIVKLNEFLPLLDRDEWMSPKESYEEVSYDRVRVRNAKRLGVRFLVKR
jgi:hypothetical protein